MQNNVLVTIWPFPYQTKPAFVLLQNAARWSDINSRKKIFAGLCRLSTNVNKNRLLYDLCNSAKQTTSKPILFFLCVNPVLPKRPRNTFNYCSITAGALIFADKCLWCCLVDFLISVTSGGGVNPMFSIIFAMIPRVIAENFDLLGLNRDSAVMAMQLDLSLSMFAFWRGWHRRLKALLEWLTLYVYK